MSAEWQVARLADGWKNWANSLNTPSNLSRDFQLFTILSSRETQKAPFWKYSWVNNFFYYFFSKKKTAFVEDILTYEESFNKMMLING